MLQEGTNSYRRQWGGDSEGWSSCVWPPSSTSAPSVEHERASSVDLERLCVVALEVPRVRVPPSTSRACASPPWSSGAPSSSTSGASSPSRYGAPSPSSFGAPVRGALARPLRRALACPLP